MLLVDTLRPPSLASPIPGVATDAEWREFVAALTVQPVTATSESGGIGMFGLRPFRLAEIGIMAPSVGREKLAGGRWREHGDFVAPWSRETFMLDEQHQALALSIRAYLDEVAAGKLTIPSGVSTAGALAILQRGKRAALRAYPKLLSDTRTLYDRCKGCFR